VTEKQKRLLFLIGLGIIGALALSAGGYLGVEYWLSSENAKKWAPALASAESQYGIPSGLLSRIAYQESSFETNVINGTTPSSAGALGMMQLEPEYFSSVQVPTPFTDSDTQAQILQAAQLLSSDYAEFGNWADAVAAYNAGAGTVSQYLSGQLASLPPETQNYVAAISADVPAIGQMTAQAGSSPAGGTGSTGNTGSTVA
jgi:soluble lytic murein transglycosylase-like protein